MAINPLALTIRAKKLGVLIMDARRASNKSIRECADAIGVSEQIFEEYESGSKAPSLPELELLAYNLNVPLDQFWSKNILSTGAIKKDGVKTERLIGLRQRIIGVLLRQARLDAGFTLEVLAEQAHFSPALLEAYELGEMPVPLPDLEVLTGLLNRPLKEFQDRRGPVSIWADQQHYVRDFLSLSPQLQAFVSKPVNRPYLELASRLSDMSVDKLRSIAEVLLEITF